MDDGWLVSAYNMTERSAKARTDTLTKLGNRLMFHEQLTELLAKPDRAPEMAAMLVIDLDRFKAINESLGRNIGDGLLRLVAERIRSALERDDIVARLGADKFGIIQTGQPQPQSAANLAGRLIDLIGRCYLVEGQLIDIAARVGIALLPAGPTDCEQLLKNADLALHRANGDGYGTNRFFDKAMDEKMQYRRNLEIDLRRAFGAGRVRPGLSASSQSATECRHRVRSSAPLAKPDPRCSVTARIYSGRGRYRHHYLDRRMGASDRLPRGSNLARCAQGFRQCFGDPVQEPKSCRDGYVGAVKRPRSAASGA
jgi:diguanylate cyclase (GGDEF)-like protein